MSYAEEIVNGELCALCMMPFEYEIGYPCACAECWDKDCGYQLAPEDAEVDLSNEVAFDEMNVVRHPDEERFSSPINAGKPLFPKDDFEDTGLVGTIFGDSNREEGYID